MTGVWISTALALLLGLVVGWLIRRAERRLAAERTAWRALREWIEYRSQADRALFPPDPNLEQRINRLAQSHTEPLRRRLEALEHVARQERRIPALGRDGQ